MKKLTIKRSEWLRGEGGCNSALRRRSDGKMCCLGFLGLSLGGTPEQLTERGIPDTTQGIEWGYNFVVDDEYTNFTAYLMTINDSKLLPDQEREETLTKRFLEAGIEVEFID